MTADLYGNLDPDPLFSIVNSRRAKFNKPRENRLAPMDSNDNF